MEFIQEQIAEINENNNTAQQDLSDVLDNISKQTTELIFLEEEWSGEIDFSLLKQKGFHNVVKIEIQKASITAIKNLPLNLSTLICRNNLLTSLTDLPKGLVELDVESNYLQTLDIRGLKNLTRLVVSNNQLTELAPLGESLKIIECNRNHLASLDLLPCKQLSKLHCSGNRLLVLKDPPTTLVDLKMDTHPTTEIQQRFQKASDPKEIEEKVDFADGIRAYFKLKAEYEERQNALKRAAYEREVEKSGTVLSMTAKREARKRANAVKAPCINCKRRVGTIFTLKDKKYRAFCGDVKDPCSLNIQIFGGRCSNRVQTLYQFKEQVEELKESIMKQKMDTLFHYLEEKESAALFKKNLEEYHSTNVLFKEMLETHEELYDSPYKRELIQRKEVEIYEFLRQIREWLGEYQKKIDTESDEQRESAEAMMNNIISLYNDSLVHAVQSLRMLKYKAVEMEADDNGLYTLRKFVVSPLDLDYPFGESPHVIKYIKSK